MVFANNELVRGVDVEVLFEFRDDDDVEVFSSLDRHLDVAVFVNESGAGHFVTINNYYN